jgi:hypothetical protein
MALRIRFVDPGEKKPKKRVVLGGAETPNEEQGEPQENDARKEQAHAEPRGKKKVRAAHATDELVDLTKNVGVEDHAWLAPLGWHGNPFRDALPSPLRNFFVDRDEARAALQVIIKREGRFGIIEGPRGSGTSFLLAWLARELEEHKRTFRVIHEKLPLEPETFTKTLTDHYAGLFSSYKGETTEELVEYLEKREKKTIILLFDDADTLGPLEALLQALLKANNVSVVLTGYKPPRLREPNVLVQLGELEPKAAIELVRKRIEAVGGRGTHPLTQDQLRELWDAAGSDIHSYLASCELAAKEAASKPVHSDTEAAIVDTAREHASREHAEEERKRSRFDNLIEDLADPEEAKKK